ncbi:hypothetical protein [Nocardia sp. N2S4-5]|uniref:hypothetical protein n=1 Tax=Nocardia sp. N2S4-5 TaxID=3351565 RepID=UPI0037D6D4BD
MFVGELIDPVDQALLVVVLVLPSVQPDPFPVRSFADIVAADVPLVHVLVQLWTTVLFDSDDHAVLIQDRRQSQFADHVTAHLRELAVPGIVVERVVAFQLRHVVGRILRHARNPVPLVQLAFDDLERAGVPRRPSQVATADELVHRDVHGFLWQVGLDRHSLLEVHELAYQTLRSSLGTLLPVGLQLIVGVRRQQ